jgi:hypothetical protein
MSEAKRLYRNRFKTAIELQDACNLRAVARKLVEAADEAAEIEEALARREAGEALADIGRSYGVSHSTISRL